MQSINVAKAWLSKSKALTVFLASPVALNAVSKEVNL